MPTQQSVASLSWYIALLSVVFEFTISGNLLTSLGTSYILDGGLLISKIHPGSYAAAISLILKLATRPSEPQSCRVALVRNWRIHAFMAGVAYCCLYVAFTSGTVNLVVLIDTFAPAGMLAMVLTDITPQQARTLQFLVRSLLVLNAIIALVELASHSHLVPVPNQANDFAEEFRPTALYDHPLTGATVAMLGLWIPCTCTASRMRRALYLGLLLSSLIAFGERAPLCVISALITLFSLCTLVKRIRNRTLRSIEATYFLATPILIAAVYLIAASGNFGTRLAAHLYWDASAQVRLSQFSILTSLNAQELLFGCSRTDLLAMVEPLRLATHVAVIENFWLLTLVSLGVITFPVFVLSFLSMLHWLWLRSEASGRIMLITFTCVASGSNSLGRKSTLLITLVACVLCASGKLMNHDAYQEVGSHQ